jgi:pSer/pThr/pTyr-binding forkhead associated (FHA) protein
MEEPPMSSIRVLFNGEDVMSTELDKEFYVIGRQEGCEIRIDNLGVSRNHARLMHDAEGFYVEDLGSSNGTYVNG